MARKKKNNSKPVEEYSKGALIFCVVTSIIVGVVSLLLSIAAIIFLPIALLLFACAYVCMSELKSRKKVQAEKEAREAERQREKEEREAEDQRKKEALEEERRKHVYMTFKVAGVTFNNGRKTRQAILRAFKFGDEEIETIDFEQYTYEGRPAVYVKINDQIIGNVPKDRLEEFLEYERLYTRSFVGCEIYGGNKKQDGSRTNFSCEIMLKYYKGEA